MIRLRRKFTAFILFALFVTCQYAKLVSYWECLLLNTINPSTQTCDCEKIITEVKQDSQASLPAHHNNKIDHIDDPFTDLVNSTAQVKYLILNQQYVTETCSIVQGIAFAIEHPPQRMVLV